MGEGEAVVIINKTDAYAVKEGHNNENIKVIELAMKLHQSNDPQEERPVHQIELHWVQ